MWMLDTNYDGRSIYPSQVFLPLSSKKEGWFKLAKNLNADIDEDKLKYFNGNTSLPFQIGEYKRIAVSIIDDRGISSLRVISIDKDAN